MTHKDKQRLATLETLGNHHFGDPADALTALVRRCLELCKIPLDKFTVGDLRIMIGQQLGLTYLVPLALEQLSKNIFIEADFYPGDLLANVLSIDITYWQNNKALWTQLNDLIKDRRSELISNGISTSSFYSV